MVSIHNAKEVVECCIDHLFDILGSDGKFIYAHRQFDTESRYNGYNLLRHCGTIWFMLKAIKLMKRPLTESELHQLKIGVLYISGKLKQPSWVASTLPTLCLTSKDKVKLGGAGLALLMLNAYSEIDDQSAENNKITCARIENYIFSQLSGSDFIHKRAFSTGAISPFRSDYYTGEALFSLMESTRRVQEIRSAMEDLMRKGYGLAEQSHLMAYAACAALRTGYCNRELVANYLRDLVVEIVRKSEYRLRYQSTPIACRSEALAEFLIAAIEEDPKQTLFPADIRRAALKTLEENLKLQLEYYADGQFRKGRGSERVQIDYVQHNGAAFLGYWFLKKSEISKL